MAYESYCYEACREIKAVALKKITKKGNQIVLIYRVIAWKFDFFQGMMA